MKLVIHIILLFIMFSQGIMCFEPTSAILNGTSARSPSEELSDISVTSKSGFNENAFRNSSNEQTTDLVGTTKFVLLNKEHYYKECLKSLKDLSFKNGYSELLINTENMLQVTNKHASIEQSIVALAESIFKKNVSLENVSCINGEPDKGLSGNPIFKIDISPNSFLIVKAFKNASGEFSKEFLTLHTYNNHKTIPDLRFPQVLGIGVTEIGQDRYFLMGMQFVDGIAVNDLFIKIFYLEKGSPKRNELLNLLEKIYTKMGKGLAQFHYQRRETDKPIPPNHLASLEKLVSAAHAFLQSRVEGMTLAEKLKSVIHTKKWLELTSQRFDLGYMHSDVHPGNFITNLESDELYLIDTGTETIGPDKNPIGLPFLDIAQVYNQLCYRTIWGLSIEEVDLLFSCFTEAYTSKANFPNDHQMLFFQIIDTLNFFVWYDQIKEKLNESSQEIIGQIYQYRLEKCHTILADFIKIKS